MNKQSNSIGSGEFLLPMELFNLMLRFCANYGFSVDTLLQGTGVSLRDLLSRPDFVGNDTYNALLGKLLQQEPDPLLPWRYASDLNRQSQGLLGLVLRSSSHLSSVYDDLPTLYASYVGYSQTLETRHAGRFFEVVIRSGAPTAPAPIVRFNTISSLMNIAWWNRVLTGVGGETLQGEVHLIWPDPKLSELERLMPSGLTAVYEAEDNFIKIPRSLLALPIASASESTKAAALAECELQLRHPPPGLGIVDSVRWVLRTVRPEMPTIEFAAKRLNVSPATLKRRLKAEGTTYQKQKDNERFTRAVELLVATNLAIEKVAFEVGFDNASNLSKAFRGRFGVSPGEYRRDNGYGDVS